MKTGWGCSSVTEHLLSMHRALISFLVLQNRKTNNILQSSSPCWGYTAVSQGGAHLSHKSLPKFLKLDLDIYVAHRPHQSSWNEWNHTYHTYRKNTTWLNFPFIWCTLLHLNLKRQQKNLFAHSAMKNQLLAPEIYYFQKSHWLEIWVTLEGHKISINFRMSGLSVAYSETQHSKW